MRELDILHSPKVSPRVNSVSVLGNRGLKELCTLQHQENFCVHGCLNRFLSKDLPEWEKDDL